MHKERGALAGGVFGRLRALTTLVAVFALTLAAACGPGGVAGGGELTVRMLYGSEKRAWIEAVTADFNGQRVRSPGGRSIRVEAVPMGSAESLERILDGTDKPAIWSPASGLLVPTANQRWASANNGAQLVADGPPPLVLSPVVIAMWRPMAEALGWPAKPFGWGDIADITRAGKSWKDYGHPEWGAFQWGHTHPEYSNSGIVSVVATAYAATGKTRGLTVADVQRPETGQFIGAVESAVIHYGESTGFMADAMFSRGPGYLSAAALYENLVVEANDPAQPAAERPQLPVVAIYPKEGTFWSDHPFAILQAPWVDADLRAASEAYRDFLLARPQQERALGFGFRPADTSVATGAPIVAARGVDPAEPRTLLQVPSADVVDAALAAWRGNKKRVEVEVVLDTSGSMRTDDRLGKAKTALASFIRQLADEDQLALTTFSSTATQLSPMGPVGPKRTAVMRQVEGLFPDGNTRLIDTLGEAYARVQAAPPGTRIRSVVLLSDGDDTASRTTAETIQRQLSADREGRAVKVYTIAYGKEIDKGAQLLDAIAKASGAKAYRSDVADIDRVYRDIATFF